jgi:hypothetical protein
VDYLEVFNAFCEGKGSPEDLSAQITFAVIKDIMGRSGFREVWDKLPESTKRKILAMNVSRAEARITMMERIALQGIPGPQALRLDIAAGLREDSSGWTGAE